MKLRDSLRAIWNYERPSDPVLRLLDDGFEVLEDSSGTSVRVSWADVVQIDTYKVDLLTTDMICVQFILTDERCVTISEEWEGFADVAGAMLERFPDISRNWFVEVMHPAFATNFTTLFEARASGSGSSPA